MNTQKLIETDEFEFEFLSRLAEKESWRKEIHRPIYHAHKWWAKRLGSIFRGILLGSSLDSNSNLKEEYYKFQNFQTVVFDPFMGSGTTIGEAHKLGITGLGRDINPVAVESVRIALGKIDEQKLNKEFQALSKSVGEKIRGMYRSKDSHGRNCDILYYFWVMQTNCPGCAIDVDLFSSRIIARNAYPSKKPEVKVVCPNCQNVFESGINESLVTCSECKLEFDQNKGNAKGSKATCNGCNHTFSILQSLSSDHPPKFRLYAKLVLTEDGKKEYLKVSKEDLSVYKDVNKELKEVVEKQAILLPKLKLTEGHNTKQAMSYGFKQWKDFFNDRQLLCLGLLNKKINQIQDKEIREVFLLLFSGLLEFNNLFASYKGEGTGAVRHMFSHHILKPEKTPIEANIWGTPKSSGSFLNLFKSRISKISEYKLRPTEINLETGKSDYIVSESFSDKVENDWPVSDIAKKRAIYLSCGDSTNSSLKSKTIDLVVTDPPFFDNVYYSELADFFYAWQQLYPRGFINDEGSTRSQFEVQDGDSEEFSKKLKGVFVECNRVLKDDGLLVFTYHHSKEDGWTSLAKSIIGSGFYVVNAHPVKSEMSSATPKSQTKSPIQIDIIIVCRKSPDTKEGLNTDNLAQRVAKKIAKLTSAGIKLSSNDEKVIYYGQLLTLIRSMDDVDKFEETNNDAYIESMQTNIAYAT